jgi:hypothetical protein
MTQRIMFVLTCVVVLLLAGAYWIGWRQGKATLSDGRTSTVATATEIFNLRSRCADLGQKIMDSNVIGPALTQSQVSHYDPRSNRCYVRLDLNTADLSVPPEKALRSSFLYDGQTGEMLATIRVDRGQRFAQIYLDGWRDVARSLGMPELGQHPVEKSIPEFDFVTVQGFISEVMKEDRHR